LDMAQKENDIGILKKECDRLTEELKKTKFVYKIFLILKE